MGNVCIKYRSAVTLPVFNLLYLQSCPLQTFRRRSPRGGSLPTGGTGSTGSSALRSSTGSEASSKKRASAAFCSRVRPSLVPAPRRRFPPALPPAQRQRLLRDGGAQLRVPNAAVPPESCLAAEGIFLLHWVPPSSSFAVVMGHSKNVFPLL